MMCKKPSQGRGGKLWPCGQCLFCRINILRKKTTRIMLERKQHENSTFATFTLNDDYHNNSDSLDPDHLRLFWYKLRNLGYKFRYYAVGEYGGQLFGEPKAKRLSNPHYHAALFGFPNCLRGETDLSGNTSCCQICDIIQGAWGLGRIHLGTLEPASAMYIAQYVTKKMTGKDDNRLGGRFPEFSRSSNRPGIGFGAVKDLAVLCNSDSGLHHRQETGDIPKTLCIDNQKQVPLDRYLRIKIRKELNLNEPHLTPEKAKIETKMQMYFQRQETLKERITYFKSHDQSYLDAKFNATKYILDQEKQRLSRIEQRLNMPRESKLNEIASL